MEYWKKALNILEKTLGSEHHDVAMSYNNIGYVYYYQKDYPKALEYWKKALEIYKKTVGTEHQDIKTLMENIDFLKQKMSHIED